MFFGNVTRQTPAFSNVESSGELATATLRQLNTLPIFTGGTVPALRTWLKETAMFSSFTDAT